MPFTPRDLIAGEPVTVKLDETVEAAVSKMREHDYSQLPIIDSDERPVALITERSILRARDLLDTPLGALTVSHAIEERQPPVYEPEGDLFELLDDLRQWNAALIVSADKKLVGIVTSSDATDFLRRRSEDLMLIEDIELAIRRLIVASTESARQHLITESLGERDKDRKRVRAIVNRYLSLKGGEKLDEQAFAQAIDQPDQKGAPPSFEDLSFAQYMQLLLDESRWQVVNQGLGVEREKFRNLLDGVRDIRNTVAHFRGTPDARARDRLRYVKALLNHRDRSANRPKKPPAAGTGDEIVDAEQVDPAAEVIDPKDSRYARLGTFLGNQTASEVELTFGEVEKIIGARLPTSARVHRAWWANDETSHTQSINWTRTGWRVDDVDVEEEWVTFTRIPARERMYKKFYEDLLAKLRKQPGFPLRNTRLSGNSWIWVADLRHGDALGHFGFSFAQGRRFRVELYIDSGHQATNKAFFDQLSSCQTQIERDVSPAVELKWERLDERRASRIAIYEPAMRIDEPARLEALSDTALDLMLRFYKAITAAVATLVPTH